MMIMTKKTSSVFPFFSLHSMIALPLQEISCNITLDHDGAIENRRIPITYPAGGMVVFKVKCKDV